MSDSNKTQQKLVDTIRATKAGAQPAQPAATTKKVTKKVAKKAPAPRKKTASRAASTGSKKGSYQSGTCRVWPD